LTEEEELEEEQREYERKVDLNKNFNNFCKQIEKLSNDLIIFDYPFEDLNFTGIFGNNNATINLTKDCIISLSEWPVIVYDMNDVDHVFFERVDKNKQITKNFDVIIVFKD